MENYVYIIQFYKWFKIGFSRDPIERLKTLRSGTKLPYKHTLIALKQPENANQLERLLHKKYAHKRTDGEYFNLSESDVNDIIKTYSFGIINKPEIYDFNQLQTLVNVEKRMPQTELFDFAETNNNSLNEIINTEEEFVIANFTKPINNDGLYLQTNDIKAYLEGVTKQNLNVNKIGQALTKLEFENKSNYRNGERRKCWAVKLINSNNKNAITEFINNECKLVSNHYAPIDIVYKAYTKFCGMNYYEICSRNNFTKQLIASEILIDLGKDNYGVQKHIKGKNLRCMIGLKHNLSLF